MGPTALIPLRRKACWGFFPPEKSWRLQPGLNPRTWVLKRQHATPRPPKPLSCIYLSQNRGLRIRVFVTLFFETSLYFKSCNGSWTMGGGDIPNSKVATTLVVWTSCVATAVWNKSVGMEASSTCGLVHSYANVHNVVYLPSPPKSRLLSPLVCTERIRREIQLTLTTIHVQ
jgi:hypothetical protein